MKNIFLFANLFILSYTSCIAQLGPEDTFGFAKIRIKNTDHSGYTGKIKLIGEKRGIKYTANLKQGYAKVKLPYNDTYTIYCKGHKNHKKLSISDFPYITHEYESYIFRFAIINVYVINLKGHPVADEKLTAKGIHNDTIYTSNTNKKGKASFLVPFEDAYSISTKYRPDFQIVRGREQGQPYTIINVNLVSESSKEKEFNEAVADSIRRISEIKYKAYLKKQTEIRKQEQEQDSIYTAIFMLPEKVYYYKKILALNTSEIIDYRNVTPPFSKEEVYSDFEKNMILKVVDEKILNWKDNSKECKEGNISDLAKANFLAHINYFRRMTGVWDKIKWSEEKNKNCQKCALISFTNNYIDHHPHSTVSCFSNEGATACGYSNLSYGHIDYTLGHISMYMDDFGSHNYSVGHRRWIINPGANEMGIGATNMGTALGVFPNYSKPQNTKVRDGFVAWPPRGYVPKQVIYPRWSFGLELGDFGNAKVEMLDINGNKIKLKTLKLFSGCGIPTIVWEPEFRYMKKGERFEVIISNVKVQRKRYLYRYWVEAI
ncbi:MAG: CAP domain-containing protein [Saprospiraceae bacterium]|nr:CAP domain-containing protein [Saprospiraceae bacterium]